MAMKLSRRELLDRWRDIEEEEDSAGSNPSKLKQVLHSKESWFSDAFSFLIALPKEIHIWCGCWDIMGPLLETAYQYFKNTGTQPKLLWERVSQELRHCTQCICQHHQAQDMYATEYESETVAPLLNVLQQMDEERVSTHLKEINTRISQRKYDTENDNTDVVSILFEVLTFPILLDDQSLVDEFQVFIEAVDDSHELSLAGQQQYPGVYALLFLKSGSARSIGFRLARSMGKLRRGVDLEPLQPFLKKCIGLLGTEISQSSTEILRPRVQLEKLTVWLGIKSLLGFLEPLAFEEGVLERHPIFLSIILNHISDDGLEFTYATNCLRLIFEMLGCKLWLRTTFSPSVMRNTLLGQCFHTRNEKSHKDIFDVFQPFLQSLEALQDGEHEKQRRHFLYFLLHQVNQSSNFSQLMRKKARKVALLIINSGYAMDPPCPPFECSHMWGPPLVCSLKDSSLHSSLRQPAFDLIHTIILSDASALSTLRLRYNLPLAIDPSTSADFNDDEDEILLSHDVEEKENSCWDEFSVQSKLISRDCKEWMCIPMLWLDVLTGLDPSSLPISFSKVVFWAISRFSTVELGSNKEMDLSAGDWVSTYATEVSAALGWETPNGSNDGGGGKVSRNSIKASSLCIPLIRTFKRYAEQFIALMERGNLYKQWTWEPRMAESLILLIIDSQDNVRQLARLILEHVSNARGLSAGLKFLCSSAVSLSAIYLGFKHAMRAVLLDSVLSKFDNLHHVFFILFKLLKETVSSPEKLPHNFLHDSIGLKFQSEGGFLHQPSFNICATSSPGFSSNSVDLKSWDKFCFSLAEIVWPSILKCLMEGKAFIDSRSSQMTCIRLLELLPVAFEKLTSFSFKKYGNSKILAACSSDFQWLHDLMDWGKTSLAVLIRHWKQCVASLLSLLKDPCSQSTFTIGAIERLISCEAIPIGDLKDQISHLSVSFSVGPVENEALKPNASVLKATPDGRRSVELAPCLDGKAVSVQEKIVPLRRTMTESKVIVLSDDETEKVLPDVVVLSCGRSTQDISDNKITTDQRSKQLHSKNFPDASKLTQHDGNASKEDSDAFKRGPSAKFTTGEMPTPAIDLKVQDGNVQENLMLRKNASSSQVCAYDPVHRKISDQTCVRGTQDADVDPRGKDLVKEVLLDNEFEPWVCGIKTPGSSKSSVANSDVTVSKVHATDEKEQENNMHILRQNMKSARDDIFDRSATSKSSDLRGSVGSSRADVDTENVFDTENDPFEQALKVAAHSQSTKLGASVPKRRVIQLAMPISNRLTSFQRMNPSLKRFRPPRLDNWYRSILEINYFSAVGLSSANEDENVTVAKLKEIPLSFSSSDHYVEIFQPLVLEEFKAQLQNSYAEAMSTAEMCIGKLCILSVERVDDFHFIRCICDDNDSTSSRIIVENDLVLLTKMPFQNSAQNVHVIGKVEKLEKDNKSRSNIFVVRFYLQNGFSRLNKVKRLLVERSKWCASRIMSITPQLREFQALSSAKDIPMLPIILNPIDQSHGYARPNSVELSQLLRPMQDVLKSSFNDRQLQAINAAIGSQFKKGPVLSLIQGPPGTGKTRTIIAIVSGLLALGSLKSNDFSKECSSTPVSTTSIKARNQINQSVAIAKAWQDAAFAKQLANEEHMISRSTVNSRSIKDSSRVRVLLCAQSNAAVDELVSRISTDGLYGNDGNLYKPYLVRVGNAKTVHPNSIPFFIDTLVEQRLAEEKMSDNIDGKNNSNSDSSTALRSKLEKLVDRVRSYEAKRANLKDCNADMKSTSENVDLKEDMSDEVIGAKLKILYAQKRAIYLELAASQARERRAFEEVRALKHKLRKEILREAEIVMATLSGCGGDLYGVCSESCSGSKIGNLMEDTLFDAVVIDEAAQALEPATLIPLQLLKSNGTKCIMVGDPKQLPATVISNVASKFLYECSMFERLQRAGHPVITLIEQYRMHPEICQFPSLHFYDNKLMNGDQTDCKTAPFHENMYLRPYLFFDVIDGLEHQGKNFGTFSLSNESESDAAIELLKLFKKRYPAEFVGGRIGVITPYRSQLSLLRSRFTEAFGPGITADMEFNTVDGFQGREVDILIFSTVRASDRNSKASVINSNIIGFVADVRRMNVALTRAKLSLWIVGNARTLRTDRNWAALLNNAKERDLVIPVSRPYHSTFKKQSSSSRNLESNHSACYSGQKKHYKMVDDSVHGIAETECAYERGGKQSDGGVENQTSKKTSLHVSGAGRKPRHRKRRHRKRRHLTARDNISGVYAQQDSVHLEDVNSIPRVRCETEKQKVEKKQDNLDGICSEEKCDNDAIARISNQEALRSSSLSLQCGASGVLSQMNLKDSEMTFGKVRSTEERKSCLTSVPHTVRESFSESTKEVICSNAQPDNTSGRTSSRGVCRAKSQSSDFGSSGVTIQKASMRISSHAASRAKSPSFQQSMSSNSSERNWKHSETLNKYTCLEGSEKINGQEGLCRGASINLRAEVCTSIQLDSSEHIGPSSQKELRTKSPFSQRDMSSNASRNASIRSSHKEKLQRNAKRTTQKELNRKSPFSQHDVSSNASQDASTKSSHKEELQRKAKPSNVIHMKQKHLGISDEDNCKVQGGNIGGKQGPSAAVCPGNKDDGKKLDKHVYACLEPEKKVSSRISIFENDENPVKKKKGKTVSTVKSTSRIAQDEPMKAYVGTSGQVLPKRMEMSLPHGITTDSCSESVHKDHKTSDCDKTPSQAETRKDLICSRRRQREEVDALLSSALLTSKKPKISSKPDPIGRPLSPAAVERHVIKPPRQSKDHACDSPVQVQERATELATCQNYHRVENLSHSSNEVDLNIAWKCFKDLIQDTNET